MSKLAIIIPTLGRDDRLPGLVENIRETTSDFTIYFVCERGKSIGALELLSDDVKVFIGDFGSPAKAVNYAVKKTKEPFFLFGNDDFRFEKDWDKNAFAKMTPDVSVVAIHDGNPGEVQWGTITLIRRKYIDEMGGTENPGETFHEGYGHWYVDSELWERAKSRGVTAIAEDSRIEHLHHIFGKADPKEYQKKGKSIEKDSQLYMSRVPQWQ